jgi:ribose-phosphate pyrophosphokinase
MVTNTIPLAPAMKSKRIEVLSVAPLISEAITRIHDGRSVSELF